MKTKINKKNNNKKKKVKNEEKIFANGYCFKKIFIFFLIGCLLGTYYEEILYLIKTGHFQSRQGLIYGPFSPIYGIGVAIFVIFLGKHNDELTIFKTWLYSALIGGITEFMTSLIADKVFGVEFWNYKGMFLNIMGRTTIPFMIFWGLGGLVLMKVVYPFISKWLHKIPYKVGNIIYYIVFSFIMIDVILTYSALGLMALRNNGKEPYTFIGEFYDKVYDNDFLYEKFPIMKPNNDFK